jgi:hypothetical protein
MSNPATPCTVCGQPTRSVTGACRRTVDCRRAEGRVRYETDKNTPAGQRRRSYIAAWYAAHREEENAKSRSRYEANRNGINAKRKIDYAANPDFHREQRLKSAHGMRPEEWTAMYNAQGRCCYLCGQELDIITRNMTHIDHDHKHCPPEKSCSVCRRGLACRGCNRAIGMADEDPVRLRRMADALEAAQTGVEERRLAN